MKSTQAPGNWLSPASNDKLEVVFVNQKAWPPSKFVFTDFQQLRSPSCWFVVVFFLDFASGQWQLPCKRRSVDSAPDRTRAHAHSSRWVCHIPLMRTLHGSRCFRETRVRVIILCSVPSRSLMSLLNIPHCSFPQVPSSPTGSRSRPSASTTSMGRSFRENPCEPARWSGLTQLQAQLMSSTPPTSSATRTRSTRRSTSSTATTISSARTTLPWYPPQIQKVCRTQEHPAAASKQQLAEFLRCSDLQASGNGWQVTRRVVQASRKLGQFRTENLLQQRIKVLSRKGREIETQTLCIRWKTKKISKKSLNGKLTWPSEERWRPSGNSMRLRREIGKRKIPT